MYIFCNFKDFRNMIGKVSFYGIFFCENCLVEKIKNEGIVKKWKIMIINCNKFLFEIL